MAFRALKWEEEMYKWIVCETTWWGLIVERWIVMSVFGKYKMNANTNTGNTKNRIMGLKSNSQITYSNYLTDVWISSLSTITVEWPGLGGGSYFLATSCSPRWWGKDSHSRIMDIHCLKYGTWPLDRWDWQFINHTHLQPRGGGQHVPCMATRGLYSQTEWAGRGCRMQVLY